MLPWAQNYLSLIPCISSLSIARIFGGFPESFFSTYHKYLPKTEPVDQYELRMDLYELFHYLNHTLIFGVCVQMHAFLEHRHWMPNLGPLCRKRGEKDGQPHISTAYIVVCVPQHGTDTARTQAGLVIHISRTVGHFTYIAGGSLVRRLVVIQLLFVVRSGRY